MSILALYNIYTTINGVLLTIYMSVSLFSIFSFNKTLKFINTKATVKDEETMEIEQQQVKYDYLKQQDKNRASFDANISFVVGVE